MSDVIRVAVISPLAAFPPRGPSPGCLPRSYSVAELLPPPENDSHSDHPPVAGQGRRSLQLSPLVVPM
jgi:hypothetical protein